MFRLRLELFGQLDIDQFRMDQFEELRLILQIRTRRITKAEPRTLIPLMEQLRQLRRIAPIDAQFLADAVMHQLGQGSCLQAIDPQTRQEQTLNCVSAYNFGWQIAYLYDDDVAPLLPAGTILHVTHWYNNTASNKWAVDPRNMVLGGGRSIDEMMSTHLTYTYLTDEDYARLVRERTAKNKASSTTSQQQ